MRISIEKFQQLYSISLIEANENQKATMLIEALMNKSFEEVSKFSEKKNIKLCKKIAEMFQSISNLTGSLKKYVFINWKLYYLNYDLSKMNCGKYIEIATFSNDTIKNLHKILATMCNPIRLTWKGFKKREIDGLEHENISIDFLNMKINNGYKSVFEFLKSFNHINERYEYLFQQDKFESDENASLWTDFNKHFGWMYNATMVSELEKIELDNVYKLPIYQFLNDLSFIKMKRNIENEEQKRILNKQKINGK